MLAGGVEGASSVFGYVEDTPVEFSLGTATEVSFHSDTQSTRKGLVLTMGQVQSTVKLIQRTPPYRECITPVCRLRKILCLTWREPGVY